MWQEKKMGRERREAGRARGRLLSFGESRPGGRGAVRNKIGNDGRSERKLSARFLIKMQIRESDLARSPLSDSASFHSSVSPLSLLRCSLRQICRSSNLAVTPVQTGSSSTFILLFLSISSLHLIFTSCPRSDLISNHRYLPHSRTSILEKSYFYVISSSSLPDKEVNYKIRLLQVFPVLDISRNRKEMMFQNSEIIICTLR